MNIIKRKSDNVVIFKGDDLVLDKNGCRGKGWGFNKIPSNDLLLEQVDELPVGFAPGLCTYLNGVWGKTAEANEIATRDLGTYAKHALMIVDELSDILVNTVIGRRDTEYLMAEKQAQAYIDANYKGDTFPYVDSWAQAKGVDQKWAADNIIETASNWRTVQSDMRAKRLKAKEDIRNAESVDTVDQIVNQWRKYIDIITKQLGA
jgi:hypothetical protein